MAVATSMAKAFGPEDRGWQRHPDPWSVYTRIPIPASLTAAVPIHTSRRGQDVRPDRDGSSSVSSRDTQATGRCSARSCAHSDGSAATCAGSRSCGRDRTTRRDDAVGW